MDVQKIVDDIATTLEDITKNKMYVCNGELSYEVDDEDNYAVAWMDDFFCESSYDFKYIVNSKKEYCYCIVMIACGGPNIWVDTYAQEVKLAWGGWSATSYLTKETCDAIDDYWREIYDMT